MSMAFNKLYPEALVNINYQLSHSMFCEIENVAITDELIKNIKNEMNEIINKNIPIKKVIIRKSYSIIVLLWRLL